MPIKASKMPKNNIYIYRKILHWKISILEFFRSKTDDARALTCSHEPYELSRATYVAVMPRVRHVMTMWRHMATTCLTRVEDMLAIDGHVLPGVFHITAMYRWRVIHILVICLTRVAYVSATCQWGICIRKCDAHSHAAVCVMHAPTY